jgi:hypothetical protein
LGNSKQRARHKRDDKRLPKELKQWVGRQAHSVR